LACPPSRLCFVHLLLPISVQAHTSSDCGIVTFDFRELDRNIWPYYNKQRRTEAGRRNESHQSHTNNMEQKDDTEKDRTGIAKDIRR
jgi:hypothetical protein